jgi:hypothetical protein
MNKLDEQIKFDLCVWDAYEQFHSEIQTEDHIQYRLFARFFIVSELDYNDIYLVAKSLIRRFLQT